MCLLADVILAAQLASHLVRHAGVLHRVVDPRAAVEDERGAVLETVEVLPAAAGVLEGLAWVAIQ